jgi:hypothetical protein
MNGFILQVTQHPGLDELPYNREPPWTLSLPRGVKVPSGRSIGLAVDRQGALTGLLVVEKGPPITTLDRRLKVIAHADLGDSLTTPALLNLLPQPLRHFAAEGLSGSGTVPHATWTAMSRVLAEHPASAGAWDRLNRVEMVPLWITPERTSVLAMERDHVELVTRLAGFDRRDAPAWEAPPEPAPFLAGLDGFVAVEDNLIQNDLRELVGFDLINEFPVAGVAEFSDGRTKITAVNVDSRSAETVTGADLIYYNHDVDSYLAIQYKRMADSIEVAGQKQRIYRPGGDAHIDKQVVALNALAAAIPATDSDAYRLSSCAGYLKLCNPDVSLNSQGMLPGVYIPSDYWPLLVGSPGAKGRLGGVGIGYHNTPRRLTNTQIVEAFRGGLIGTNGASGIAVEAAIRASLNAGHSVTIASARTFT